MENRARCFIFEEPVVWWNDYATGIGIGYIVGIKGKYYRVLGFPEPPRRFAIRGEKNVDGWKFYAQRIIDIERVKDLDEGKMTCLYLNPEMVNESNETGDSEHGNRN